MAWRIGSLVMWMYKLRKINGPNFTWPLWMFSGAISEKTLERIGKIYLGKPEDQDPQRAYREPPSQLPGPIFVPTMAICLKGQYISNKKEKQDAAAMSAAL